MADAKVSTGTTLSQTFYMRNFYENNSKAMSSSSRKSVGNTSLSNSDIRALTRAAKKLLKFDYDNEYPKDDKGNSSVTNAVKAYVDIYNNTLSSGTKTEDPDLKRYVGQLKKYTRSHKSELESMGLKVNSDGSLTSKDSMLTSVNQEKIKKAFSKESGYMKQIQRVARSFQSKTDELLFVEATGTGSRVNTII